MRFLPKFTKHDVLTAAVLFAATFVSAVAKGGSLTTSVLVSAALAAVGAVVHTYLGKGA
jgi:hypothetical protein